MAESPSEQKVPTLIDAILGKKRDEICQSCFKRPRIEVNAEDVEEGEDLCEYCDNFTHVRDKLGVIVASYDDDGHRMNLNGLA